tara:strand:- start:92 stop:286 length:195 start_codon:yes stop_codon:yes gene_type:complete
MKIADYLMLLVLIILFMSIASCSAEEDHCYEYYYYDEELINECEVGVCTQIVQVTTTCISNEGE